MSWDHEVHCSKRNLLRQPRPGNRASSHHWIGGLGSSPTQVLHVMKSQEAGSLLEITKVDRLREQWTDCDTLNKSRFFIPIGWFFDSDLTGFGLDSNATWTARPLLARQPTSWTARQAGRWALGAGLTPGVHRVAPPLSLYFTTSGQ